VAATFRLAGWAFLIGAAALLSYRWRHPIDPEAHAARVV
jgi:hypothetical protein